MIALKRHSEAQEANLESLNVACWLHQSFGAIMENVDGIQRIRMGLQTSSTWSAKLSSMGVGVGNGKYAREATQVLRYFGHTGN